MAYDLANRVAIVTGAAAGIGQATVQKLLSLGACVIGADRKWDTAAPSENFRPITVDMRAPEAAPNLITAALDTFGRLDIIVCNAGILLAEPTQSFSDQAWEDTIGVNVTALFHLARAAIPHLRQSQHGRIINVGSVNAVRTAPGLAAYTASKSAVAGLTKALAVELGPDGITANYIMPGAILTDMTRARMEADPNSRAILENFGVLGRMGRPEEIANAIAFLASDDAAFITGHGLAVDGGFLAKR